MTLQQLKYMIEIVNSGSMNAAAEKLFITQPSLSSAVRELEKELGIELFVRSNRGIALSAEGAEFLGYARQVTEQLELLEQRYKHSRPIRRVFAVSTQHYAFSVNAFVNLIKDYSHDEYDFTLRETRTNDIIEDVKNLRSELGVLYLSDFNEKLMMKIFRENSLAFQLLFEAQPHIFISKSNPLANLDEVTLDDLKPYPCLSFEQGVYNSFYYAEEILSTVYHPKTIKVSDRATLFNLLIGLDGYTISTGILSEDLNGPNIVSVPLGSGEKMHVGYIIRKGTGMSAMATAYVEKLRHYIKEYQNNRL